MNVILLKKFTLHDFETRDDIQEQNIKSILNIKFFSFFISSYMYCVCNINLLSIRKIIMYIHVM